MIVYTVRGGASAVIWTDVVQLFVYVAGALVVFTSLLMLIPGGWAEVVRVGTAAGKFRILNLSTVLSQPYTLWAGVIGGIALTLSTHGTDQYLVQRLLSARSSQEASRGLILSGFLVFAQFVMFLLIGVMLFTYYQHVPLPRTLARNDELLPTFIVTSLSRRHRRVHRRRDCCGGLVALAQRHGRNHRERLLPEVLPERRGRSDADESLAALDDHLGRRPNRRSAWRTMDATIRPRRGPRRAFLHVRLGSRSVPARHARAIGRGGPGIHRDGRRSDGDDGGLGMDDGGVHLVRIHWRGNHDARRVADAAIEMTEAAGCRAAHEVLVNARAARVFPAATAEIGSSRGTLWDIAVGTLTFDDQTIVDLETPFDLASLTKVIATTSLMMKLVDDARLALYEPVAASFVEWRGVDREATTVRDLLEHASGLAARLVDAPPESRREFEHDICVMPLEYPLRSRSVYSDLGFILLGFLAADRGGGSLAALFTSFWTDPNLTFELPLGGQAPRSAHLAAGR